MTMAHMRRYPFRINGINEKYLVTFVYYIKWFTL